MRDRYYPVVHSVGIEIEARDVSRELIRSRLGGFSGKVINDGSIRTRKPSVAGFPFISIKNKDDDMYNILYSMGVVTDSKEMGCEIVSSIIDTSQEGWERYVFKILDALEKLGEGVATNTSIHVHVNARGLPIDVIKNVVQIWKSIESGMFRISAGPLGTYRGALHKDSHYCRPLVKQGPHVQRCSDGLYRPCFDVDAIARCNTMEDLEKALGRIDENNTQYHISRYMALGLP